MLRRQFLVNLLGGVALGPVSIGALACSRAAVAEASDAEALAQILSTMFPHKFLRPIFFEALSKSMLGSIERDIAQRASFAELKKLLGSEFGRLTQSERELRLKQIEPGALLPRIFSEGLVAVYGDKEHWKVLGFEGSSFEFGGYLARGFNDIDWLPTK